MSATESLAATVESLCGDLSAIHAPRGPELNARSWQTEAPLRMLLNNLDPEVAERPEELVVYGGSGRAARSHDALRAIVGCLRARWRALEHSDDVMRVWRRRVIFGVSRRKRPCSPDCEGLESACYGWFTHCRTGAFRRRREW